MEKTNAPDDWYDGKLVATSYERTENGSGILEMEYDVGQQYFWAKEGIFLVNAPSGDAATDAQRNEWTRNHIERIKEVYPEAVKDGKLQLALLLNPSEEILAKPVRVRVTSDGKYAKAKVYPNKGGKRQRVSKDDALKLALKDMRALASLGVAVGASEPVTTVVAGSPEAAALGIDF